MRTVIKWSGLIIAIVVLISLFYYVKEKRERPPVSGDDLLRSALIEIREHHNYPKAILLAQQALTQTPGYTDVRVTLARAYLLDGETDSAKVNLDKAIAQDPKNADALVYLTNIALQKKDTAAAIQYLDNYTLYYPEQKENWLKKYSLLLEHREYKKADTAFNRYAERFGKDSIRTVGFDYWSNRAAIERKENNMVAAYHSYQKAFTYQPHDTAVLQQLVNTSSYFADYTSALKYNNALLRRDSSNTQYLLNASSLYQKSGDEQNAAVYAAKAYAQNHTDVSVKNNLASMYLNLARDASGLNRIMYANNALEIIPQQRDALIYLINENIELKQYSTALNAADNALRYYTNDQVFIDKKIGILYDSEQFQACFDYIESVLHENPSAHNIRAYDDVALKLATGLMQHRQWNDASMIIRKGLIYNSRNRSLLEEKVNVSASMNDSVTALATINELLNIDPQNEKYLFKKSGLLERNLDFEGAAMISHALYRKHIMDTIYRNAYFNQLLGAERMASNNQNWDRSVYFYNQRTAVPGNPGYYQLQYAIAAYAGKKDSLHVLSLTDTALQYYPDDSLFTVKHSLALQDVKQYPQALQTSRTLVQKYPADRGLQLMYLDQLNTAGKYYEKENRNEEAISVFLVSHSFEPRDTFALMNLSAVYFVKKQYDSSILYANKGLQLDSNNEYLLMKKAAAHEQLKQYNSAYLSANRVLQLHPSAGIKDYAAYLKNKTYTNQAGITHLQSFFAASPQYASVTGLQYMHRFEKGSITGHVNYGDRPAGSGLQLGFDLYYTHDSAYYSNLFLYGSTGNAFPYWQGGYSLFRNFKKGWEAELGIRYLGFDSINNYTVTAAAGKYFNNTWLNARAYYTYNTKQWFQSYQVTARQYLNDKSDYISAIAGLGNVPDDQSLNYNLNNFSGLTTKSIGVGVQKNFRYRTTLQAFFNYSNIKVSPVKKLDQYDFYITLLRNF